MGTLIALGSVNADFHVRAGEAPSGSGSVLGRDLLRTSGGKAANVAVLASRLGAEVRLAACVGDDDLAEQALAGPLAEGLDLRGVRRRPGATGYSSIVVPPDGAKSIVLVPGANDAWAADAGGVESDVADAPDGSVVVVDLEVPRPLVDAALRAARDRGFTTVLDPAPPERCDDELLALAGHVTPDVDEASQLTGVDTSTREGAVEAGRRLRARGAACAYVKLADGGCALVSSDGAVVVAAPEGLDVVDATGAGDAFAGALGWALLRGSDAMGAARLAVAASACAVGAYGSQESYPSVAELEAMAARVTIR